MRDFELKSTQFREEREETWRELEVLIHRVDRQGILKLSAHDLGRLPILYRSAISSLSVARAISLDRNLLEYLENLVGRSYLAVYGTKRSPGDAVLGFVRLFPATVRRYWRFLAVSVVCLAVATLCGFLMTRADPDRYYSLVPVGMADERTPAASAETLRGFLYYTPDEDESAAAGMLQNFAAFLFTHNAKIGILCFALGFAAGAPTVALLFINGIQLGAMAAIYDEKQLGAEFWAWLLPHGITELGAVCLCATAGLILGHALVFPGELSRLENLSRRGREAAILVIGSIVLFFLAAVIEGFFRQLVHSVSVRWIVAGGSLAVWTWYFLFVGRVSTGVDDGS